MRAFFKYCRRVCWYRFRLFTESLFGAKSPRRLPRPTQRPFGASIAARVQVLEPRVCLAVPLELAVPKTVYGVVGEPAAIVFENLIPTLTADGFRFEFQCDIGTVTDKEWTVTPQVEDVGDHAWQITLWQGDVLIDSQSGVFRVTSPAFDSGRGYNLLMVGDSLTHASTYLNIMADQFSAEERHVTFLGTHHPKFAIPEVNHEGYGGWTWNRFRTYYEPDPDPAQKRYVSPFVFLEEGQPTLNVPRYYQERLAGQKPDYVMFLLGVNDLISTDDDNPTQLELRVNQTLTAAELLIQAFRAASPETEIGVCLTTPPSGRESAFTLNYAGRLTRENWKPVQHRLVEEMLQRFEGRERERIFVVPTGMNLDPMLSFPENNAVHPNVRGYGELAGSIRGWLLARMQPQPPQLGSTTFSIPENSAVGRIVGRLQLANPDANPLPNFVMTGGSFADAFAIDAVSGEIRVVRPDVLDFETNPTLDLTVSILDPDVAENNAEVTVTIQLLDENEAPTSVSLQNAVLSLGEMMDTSTRTKLADIVVTDDAIGNNIITLTGDDAMVFEVDGGTLYLKPGTVLDFESKSDYVVNIQIDDEAVGLTPDASTTLVLSVSDVIEPPPPIALLDVVTTLAENTPTEAPVKVARIVVDASFTAAVVLSGADADHFEIVDGALFLRAGTSLDFETQTTHVVTVTLDVPDADERADFRVDLALSVSNVNEQPVITTAPTPFAVNDNATILPFAALTVTDPDAQAMSAIISIKNGVARGDFTPATTFGWIRTVVGNDIRYSRSFPSVANIGATVQAAIRNFLFQSRANAIKPNTTETTVFAVTVTDGVASPVINSTTTVITTSVNDGPAISGASTSLSVNDNAVINPFSTLTVVDADHQEMLISVTILNGVNRGDFTNALSSGWTVRQVVGNNITYKRYFSPAPNVGSLAEAAFRALTFQPRSNALKPGVTELTDFQVTVSDGVAAPLMDRRTRVTTVSVNQATTMSVTMANQNDYGPIVPFNTLTVTDPDTQNLFVRVTIINGLQRGDFPTATTRGWTRKVSSGNIVLERFFGAAPNNGALVQAALREMIFEPRTTIPAGVQETTNFTVSINDGLATATESATSVAGSSVASKPLLSALKKRALSRSLIESPSPRWQVS